MKYAFQVQFESASLGRREAWVYAADADEARRLIESTDEVALFHSVVRFEGSRILCYTERV